LAPELIEDYVADFITMLSSGNNRLVWGGMIVLAMVAERKPRQVFDNREDVIQAIKEGSVITRDNGIKTLATVASLNEDYNRALMPFLIDHLQGCRPKSVPQHAESVLRAVMPENREQYVEVLRQRFSELSSSQQKRAQKLLRTLEG
jgi:hypothetical protein